MAIKSRRVISEGIAHVTASFNNTIITITDRQNNTLRWGSAGASEFKGSRKSTPYAAQKVAEVVAKYVIDNFSMSTIEVVVKGAGSGRESAIRALKAMGLENALGLDQGGSTALWWGGYKLGPGRGLPNAILFVSR